MRSNIFVRRELVYFLLNGVNSEEGRPKLKIKFHLFPIKFLPFQCSNALAVSNAITVKQSKCAI